KNNKTNQEREKLIKQLSQFIIRNIYTKSSYKTRKQEVDRILTELREQNNHQNQLQQKPFPFLTFSLCLIGLLLGVAIIGALVIKNKKTVNNFSNQSRNSRKN